MSDELRIRHSEAESASLISGSVEKAEKEAANALLQADRVRDYILESIDRGGRFRLRPSMLLDLNRCAIEGLDAYAGSWRPGGGATRPAASRGGFNDSRVPRNPGHSSSGGNWRVQLAHRGVSGGRPGRAARWLF